MRTSSEAVDYFHRTEQFKKRIRSFLLLALSFACLFLIVAGYSIWDTLGNKLGVSLPSSGDGNCDRAAVDKAITDMNILLTRWETLEYMIKDADPQTTARALVPMQQIVSELEMAVSVPQCLFDAKTKLYLGMIKSLDAYTNYATGKPLDGALALEALQHRSAYHDETSRIVQCAPSCELTP